MNKTVVKKRVNDLAKILKMTSVIDIIRDMSGDVTYVLTGFDKKGKRMFKVSYTFTLALVERYKGLLMSDIDNNFYGDYKVFLKEELEELSFLIHQKEQIERRYDEINSNQIKQMAVEDLENEIQ